MVRVAKKKGNSIIHAYIKKKRYKLCRLPTVVVAFVILSYVHTASPLPQKLNISFFIPAKKKKTSPLRI